MGLFKPKKQKDTSKEQKDTNEVFDDMQLDDAVESDVDNNTDESNYSVENNEDESEDLVDLSEDNDVEFDDNDFDDDTFDNDTSEQDDNTDNTSDDIDDETISKSEDEEVDYEDDSVEESAANNEDSEDIVAPKELVLYMITDKVNSSALEYFRENGLNISRIFTNISEAKDTLLMQVNPSKILIVDTGTGRFSAMGARKELMDLMGIVDEDARISFYYTDTVIKSEVEYNDTIETKDIHWHKYRSTIDTVAHCLMNIQKGTETYIYDNNDKDDVKDIDDNILDFKGLTTSSEMHSINIGTPSITAKDIQIHMSNNEDTSDEIQGYNIVV